MTENINHRKRNAKSMVTRCTTSQTYRIEENERNAESMATRRTDQAYRIEEYERNAVFPQHQSIQQQTTMVTSSIQPTEYVTKNRLEPN
jgi:hypothetical protein